GPSQRRPQAKDPPPGGFSRKRPSGFVAPQSKIHQGYSPSSRLAIRPFPRKQHPAEFSDRLLIRRGKRLPVLHDAVHKIYLAADISRAVACVVNAAATSDIL